MISFPNAKINLGLNIIEKRKDGFHNIETVFYPINICDVLEFIPNENLLFENSGLKIDGNSDNNLVVKSFKLLQTDFSIPNIKIQLHKIIPFGAGLGGGSADAAFMIKSLNEFFRLQLSNSDLKNYASKLGSDCSFFIDNVPSFATQKGEVLTPSNLYLNEYFFVIVKPEVHVPTAIAYSNIKPKLAKIPLSEAIKQPIETWKNTILNDFEKSIFKEFPEIENIKKTLYKKGAIYASMSGSGSSVFGIFKNKIELSKEFSNHYVWTSSK
jgi:4-diphosphocytidyl-2-C-methyl-D-erythritol kinase